MATEYEDYADGPIPPRMKKGVRFSLSVMMFLQFFIWGAWFELGFVYIPSLGFDADWEQPLIFGAFNVGALVALFFSTQFADRMFAAEKFLAFSHLIGGLAILGLFFIKPGWSLAIGNMKVDLSFWAFFLLMLIHSIFYVPTISITNSIAFANLSDPARQFGPVRLWGTIGWIAASWPFIFILVDWAHVPAMGDVGFVKWVGAMLGTSKSGAEALNAQRYIFLVAGVASLALAAFSLGLPHTPPKPARGGDSLAWVKAMRLLQHPFVLILFIVTFIDAAVHQSFFVWTGGFLSTDVGIPSNWVMPVMKIGQLAEIVTMLFLGYVLKTFGWRTTMVFGVLGHAARFAVFAYAPTRELAILVNVLHGICYAFFFATVYIFVDEYFPKDVRASAQGLFNVLILGAGPFVANFLCGQLKTHYTSPEKELNYSAVFQYSMGAALLGALILAVFFHPPKRGVVAPSLSEAEEDAPPAP
jgi:MFS family permease